MNDKGWTAFPLGWLGSGWQFNGASGYYIHRNRMYLQGRIANYSVLFGATTFHTVTATILHIDAALMPAAAVTQRVAVSVPDPATPGVDPTNTVTVTVDSNLTLAPLPNFINAPPSDPGLVNVRGPGTDSIDDATASFDPHFGSPVPDFSDPLQYTIPIGNISWQIVGEPVLDDEYPSESLAPYLGPNWQNIDARVGLDGSRVHLSGRVRAVKNASPLNSGPPDFCPANVITQSLPSKYLAGLQFSVPGGPVGYASVSTSRLSDLLELDLSNGYVLVNNDVRAGGTYPGGQTFVVPQDPPGQWLNYSPVIDHFESTIGGVQVHPSGSFSGGLGQFNALDPNGGRTTAAHYSQPAPGPEETAQHVYTNKNEIRYTRTPPYDEDRRDTITARLSDTINVIYPPPDWIALIVAWTMATFDDSHSVIATLSSDVGSWDLVDNTNAPVSNVSSGPGGYNVGNVAWVARPTVAYLGDPNNPASKLLWRPGELPDLWTCTGDWHASTFGFSSDVAADVIISLVPVALWEARKDYVLGGDIINLDGIGWQTPYVVTPVPGEVHAGDQAQGLRPRGWRKA